MRKNRLLLALISFLSLLWCVACAPDVESLENVSSSGETGSLMCTVPQAQSIAKSTYTPSAEDLKIAYYKIEISDCGPGTSIPDKVLEQTVVIDNIPIGPHQVTITGYNDSDVQITAPNTKQVTIATGVTTEMTFNLEKPSGNGFVDFSLSWDASLSSIRSFAFSLTKEGTSDPVWQFTVDPAKATVNNGVNTFSGDKGEALPAGTYVSEVTIYGEGLKEIFAKIQDIVYVYGGVTTQVDISVPSEFKEVEAPTISVAADGFVTITAMEGASIYYTTDGSDPTIASTKYIGKFLVEANGSIRAIASWDAYHVTSPIAIAQVQLSGNGSFSITNPQTANDYKLYVSKPLDWSGIVGYGSSVIVNAAIKPTPVAASYSFLLDGTKLTEGIVGGQATLSHLSTGPHVLQIKGSTGGVENFSYLETLYFTVVQGVGNVRFLLDTEGWMLSEDAKDFVLAVTFDNTTTIKLGSSGSGTMSTLAAGTHTVSVSSSGLKGYRLAYDSSLTISDGQTTDLSLSIVPENEASQTESFTFASPSTSGVDASKKIVYRLCAPGGNCRYRSLPVSIDGQDHSYKVPALDSGSYEVRATYEGDDEACQDLFLGEQSGNSVTWKSASRNGWGQAILRWEHDARENEATVTVVPRTTTSDYAYVRNRDVSFWGTMGTYDAVVTYKIDDVEYRYQTSFAITQTGFQHETFQMEKVDMSQKGEVAFALTSTLLPNDVRKDMAVLVKIDGQEVGTLSSSRSALSVMVEPGSHVVDASISGVSDGYKITEGLGALSVDAGGKTFRTLYADYDETKVSNLASVTVEFATPGVVKEQFRMNGYSSSYRTIGKINDTHTFRIPAGTWTRPCFRINSSDTDAYYAVDKQAWEATNPDDKYKSSDFYASREIAAGQNYVFLVKSASELGRKKVTLHYPRSYIFSKEWGNDGGDMEVTWLAEDKESADHVHLGYSGSSEDGVSQEFWFLPSGIYTPSLYSGATARMYVLDTPNNTVTIADEDSYDFDVRVADKLFDYGTLVVNLVDVPVPESIGQSEMYLCGLDGGRTFRCSIGQVQAAIGSTTTYSISANDTFSLLAGTYFIRCNDKKVATIKVEAGKTVSLTSLQF